MRFKAISNRFLLSVQADEGAVSSQQHDEQLAGETVAPNDIDDSVLTQMASPTEDDDPEFVSTGSSPAMQSNLFVAPVDQGPYTHPLLLALTAVPRTAPVDPSVPLNRLPEATAMHHPVASADPELVPDRIDPLLHSGIHHDRPPPFPIGLARPLVGRIETDLAAQAGDR